MVNKFYSGDVWSCPDNPHRDFYVVSVNTVGKYSTLLDGEYIDIRLTTELYREYQDYMIDSWYSVCGYVRSTSPLREFSHQPTQRIILNTDSLVFAIGLAEDIMSNKIVSSR